MHLLRDRRWPSAPNVTLLALGVAAVGAGVQLTPVGLSQPFPLDRDRLVPALPQFLLNGLQLRPHSRFPEADSIECSPALDP